MRVDVRLAFRGKATRILSRRRVQAIACAVMAVAIPAASISFAPRAVADSKDTLRAAVMSLRESCGPLRPNPLVEHAAEISNRMDDRWLDQEGRAAPTDDPLPILKDLAYAGNQATLLRGAARTAADAIKGLLIQGYLEIPDCSFTDYGVSVIQNRTTNYFLAATVLAA